MIPNLESSIIGKKTFNCSRHRTEQVTHICTNTKCTNGPVLCSQCFGEQINHNYHYDHEKNILPLDEAVTCLCNDIKTFSTPLQKLYKLTLGKNQFGGLLEKLDKGQQIYHEFDSQINEIKNLLETQIQILTAEFQKSLQVQKQQCFKMLDNYKKYFNKNIEYLSSHAQNMLQFNNELKYFANKNNFYLKIIENGKKGEWITKAKKQLENVSKIVDNANYSIEMSNILNTALRLKLDNEVNFRRDQTLNERSVQMKLLAKKIINQLISIPELKYLQDEVQNGSSQPSGTSSGSTGIIKNYYYSSSK